MPSRPSSPAEWRTRWDELTAALEAQLFSPEPDVDRVAALAAERAGLIALPPPAPLSEGPARDEHAAWMRRAIAREGAIVAAAGELTRSIGLSRDTLAANRGVRRRIDAADREPSSILDLDL